MYFHVESNFMVIDTCILGGDVTGNKQCRYNELRCKNDLVKGISCVFLISKIPSQSPFFSRPLGGGWVGGWVVVLEGGAIGLHYRDINYPKNL